ncbi:DUF2066 domain-containing protein [Motilimonas pumila]|nr:DUF2066 domain-containing protein [Motilimonas pumila]
MKQYFLVFISLLMTFQVHALEVKGLYQAEVAPAESELATQQAAFAKVLLKLTGSNSAYEQADIQALLPHVAQWVEKTEQGEGSQTIFFSEEKVLQVLQQIELAVWGSNRPNTVFWFVDERGGQRELVAELQQPELMTSLKRQAQQFALPITLPLLDLDDLMQVSAADVRGRFLQPVANASQRYQANGFVMVRIMEDKGNVTLNWQLAGGAMSQPHGLTQGSSEGKTAVPQMVAQISQFYADKYAVAISNEPITTDNMISVKVTNIKGMADVVKIQQFFNGLTVVKQANTQSVTANSIGLKLQLQGTRAALEQAIELDYRFQPGNQAGNTLHLVWSKVN